MVETLQLVKYDLGSDGQGTFLAITLFYFQMSGLQVVSEDETIVFEPRDHSILPFLSAFGFVGGSCFAKNSYAEGDGIIAATIGKDTK